MFFLQKGEKQMKLKDVLNVIPEDQSILIFSGAFFTWAGLRRQFLEQQYDERTVYHIQTDTDVLRITIG